MTPIEDLSVNLRRALPAAQITLDRPLHDEGVWTLSVYTHGRAIEVDWNARRGFGLSTEPLYFGAGVDELPGTAAAVLQRIVDIAGANERSV